MKENHLPRIKNTENIGYGRFSRLNTFFSGKFALLLVESCEDFLFSSMSLDSVDSEMVKEALSEALINVGRARVKFKLPYGFLFIVGLEGLLENDNSRVVIAGLKAIAQLRNPLVEWRVNHFRLINNLQDCVTDLRSEVREDALKTFIQLVNVLDEIFLVEFIENIKQGLASQNLDEKIAVLNVFAELGSTLNAPHLFSLIDTLRKCLRDSNPLIIFSGSEALLQLKNDSLSKLDAWEFVTLLESIKSRLKDKKLSVRKAGLNAVIKLSDIIDTLDKWRIGAFSEWLETCLRDESSYVRESILQFATKLENLFNCAWLNEFIQNIQKHLDNTDRDVRLVALEVLTRLSKPLSELDISFFENFSQRLNSCLMDKDSYIRMVATKAIDQLQNVLDAPRLLSFLRNLQEGLLSQDTVIIEAALHAISHVVRAIEILDEEELTDLLSRLRTLLNHKETPVRIAALRRTVQVLRFCKFDITTFVDSLRLLLADQDWSIKKAAVEAVGNLNNVVHLLDDNLFFTLADDLKKILKNDKDRALRIVALQSIGHMGNALSRLNTEHVLALIDLLRECLGDLRMGVREAAVYVIARLGSIPNADTKAWFDRFQEMLLKSLRGFDAITKTGAVKAVGQLVVLLDTERLRTFAPLIEALPYYIGTTDWSVKKAALEVVGDIIDIIEAKNQSVFFRIIKQLEKCLVDKSWVKEKGLKLVGQLASALDIADPDAFIPIIKKLPECIRDEEHDVKIAALKAVSQLGNILDRLDISVYILVIEMLQMNLAERNWHVANAAGEAVVELLVTASATQGGLFPALIRMLQECLEGGSLHVRESAVGVVFKVRNAMSVPRFAVLIDMLQECLRSKNLETKAAVVRAVRHLGTVLDNYLLQSGHFQRSLLVQFLVELWDIMLIQLENEKKWNGVIKPRDFISLIRVLLSPVCLQAILDYFEAQPAESLINPDRFKSRNTKNALMASNALEKLDHEQLLTIERAEALMDQACPLVPLVLCQLSAIGVSAGACVDSVIAATENELGKIAKAHENKNDILAILNFIRTNKLPITELNFEGWSLGRKGIQALLKCLDEIATIHTLNLRRIKLDKNDILLLCRLLDAREAPLNILTDQLSDNDGEEVEKKLKNTIERNQTRAALLSYVIPEAEKTSLPFYKSIQSLETLVTTLSSPPETYEVILNGKKLILANCHYSNKTNKKDKKLITHYPGEPLFDQLGIDEDQAIDYLFNNAPWACESIKKRLGDEIIRFIVEIKNHDDSKGLSFLNEETQALLNKYHDAYEEQDILIDEINTYLDDKNCVERLQKGFITENADALRICYSGDLILTKALDKLHRLSNLRALEDKIKMFAYSNTLIKSYLSYVKEMKSIHLSFDSLVAYLEIMRYGIAVYNPLKKVDQLTTILEKSFTLPADEGEMYYLLQDPYAGYQRLWNHALEDKQEAEKNHEEALKKINDRVEEILWQIAGCFTINNSDNLKRFNQAYKDGKALSSSYLYHFRAVGAKSQNKEAGTKSSLIATLDTMKQYSTELSTQKRFSLLKQALLDFLRLESEKLESQSNQFSNEFENQIAVKNVAASPIFIAFAKQLLLVSQRIHEVGLPQMLVKFDRKATFDAGFCRGFEPPYLAALAICSKMFESSAIKPLNQREQIMHCVGEFVLGALVAIPALGGLAHAGKATLHSLKILAEVAHAYEGVKGSLELGESGIQHTKVGHALHSVYKCVSHKATKFLLGSTLATEEMIKNLQDTFASIDDFIQKKNKLREVLYHRFKEQLNLVHTPEDVVMCGEALARHLLDKIMLGLFKPHTVEQPVLPLIKFIEACYECISYVPMENSPTVVTKEGKKITCDALFRQSGLACFATKQGLFGKICREVKFVWKDFTGMPIGKYAEYTSATTFSYEPCSGQVKYHLAGKREVKRLNKLREIVEEIRNKDTQDEMEYSVVINSFFSDKQKIANGMMSVGWNFSQQQLKKFLENFDGWRFEVIPLERKKDWIQAIKDRLKNAEIRLDNVEEEQKRAAEDRENLWNEVRELRKENKELKEKFDLNQQSDAAQEIKLLHAANDTHITERTHLESEALNTSGQNLQTNRQRFFQLPQEQVEQAKIYPERFYGDGVRRRYPCR